MKIRVTRVGTDIGGAEIVRGEDGRMYVGNQRDSYRATLDQQRQDALRKRQRQQAEQSRRREAAVFRSVLNETGGMSSLAGRTQRMLGWILKLWIKLFLIVILVGIAMTIFG